MYLILLIYMAVQIKKLNKTVLDFNDFPRSIRTFRALLDIAASLITKQNNIVITAGLSEPAIATHAVNAKAVCEFDTYVVLTCRKLEIRSVREPNKKQVALRL